MIAQASPQIEQPGCCIRACTADDHARMIAIINAAAQIYRGSIPGECWHEPYMTQGDLDAALAEGAVFSGCERNGVVTGIMGVQRRGAADLIRHAYVAPDCQGGGIGAALLRSLIVGRDKPVLIGTWRSATWAIRFYERQGFARLAEEMVEPLLRAYWRIPDRQIAASTVLAMPAVDDATFSMLMKAARRRELPSA